MLDRMEDGPDPGETMGMIWRIAVSDLLFMLREREAQVWMFLMPLGFCAFFGFMFRGHGERTYAPADFTERLRKGEPSTVVLKHKLDDLEAQSDRVKIQRAVWRLVGAVAAAAARDSLTEDSVMTAVGTPSTLKLEASYSGRKKIIPSGFGQAVPGNLVMFVLLVAFTNGAISLVVERDQGLLRRLASSPLTSSQLLAGKALSRFVLAGIEIAYFLLIGAILFGRHPQGHVFGAVRRDPRPKRYRASSLRRRVHHHRLPDIQVQLAGVGCASGAAAPDAFFRRLAARASCVTGRTPFSIPSARCREPCRNGPWGCRSRRPVAPG